MTFRIFMVLCVANLLTVSCGDVEANRAKHAAKKRAGEFERTPTVPLQFYSESETGLAYSQADSSADARIFLVAGSIRGANFAQEVIEQKRLWLKRGAKESEIACYFVIPDRENFTSDSEQYRELAPELRSCKLASVAGLTYDLALASTTEPENIYLYFTSHGDQPLGVYAAKAGDDERAKLNWLIARYPDLNRYMLAIDSIPSGSANFGMQLDAIDAGTPANEIFLTPRSLSAALLAFSPDVQKTVVLQGCYSGGFIADPNGNSQDLLNSVPSITVLTAARNDRPSFGCGVDDKKTYFGGALLSTFAAADATNSKLPSELNWSEIYELTRSKVSALETEKGFAESEPQYFSNR